MKPSHERSTNRRRAQRGSVFMESAFIFLVLVLLLTGIFDFGQFLFVHQALVERARSAARWGIVHNPDNTDAIRNKVLYDSASDPGSTGYFGLTSSNVQVSHTGAGTNDNRLTVRIVNYPYQMLSPFVAGTYTGPEIRISEALGMFN